MDRETLDADAEPDVVLDGVVLLLLELQPAAMSNAVAATAAVPSLRTVDDAEYNAVPRFVEI